MTSFEERERRNSNPQPTYTLTQEIMPHAQQKDYRPAKPFQTKCFSNYPSGLWSKIKEASGQKILYCIIYDYVLSHNFLFSQNWVLLFLSAALLSKWRRIKLCWRNQDSKMMRYGKNIERYADSHATKMKFPLLATIFRNWIEIKPSSRGRQYYKYVTTCLARGAKISYLATGMG